MSSSCVEPGELGRYLDGELTANRSNAVRAHVATCAACGRAIESERQLIADLAAPVPQRTDELVRRVMTKLDAPATPAPRRAAPRFVWAGALAAAAMLTVFVATRSTNREQFTARGPSVTADVRQELARHVGVTAFVSQPAKRQLADGDRVADNAAFMFSFRNLYSTARVYFIAFAVDAKDDVHWFYPAYVDATTDPLAIELARADAETLLPEAIELEDVAPGPLRVITIASPIPLRVSQIERLPAPELTRNALEARWRDAVIRELHLQISADKAQP
ncbi:MAG: anti-sigma factor [Kofleriaceae bacterium]